VNRFGSCCDCDLIMECVLFETLILSLFFFFFFFIFSGSISCTWTILCLRRFYLFFICDSDLFVHLFLRFVNFKHFCYVLFCVAWPVKYQPRLCLWINVLSFCSMIGGTGEYFHWFLILNQLSFMGKDWTEPFFFFFFFFFWRKKRI